MTIYIFSILLLLSLSYLELNRVMSPVTKRALSLFVYLFLVLQMGLRWETGTDWFPYLHQFESIDSFSSAAPSLAFPEYGYNIAVWMAKLTGANYSVFLVVQAAVYYYLIINSMKRYTGIVFLPLMLFYCATMGVMGSNRELIAVAIGLFALRYVSEGRYVRFFALLALASLFHYSAVILSVVPLFGRKIRPAVLVLFLACSLALSTTHLPQLLFARTGDLLGEYESHKATLYLHATTDSVLDSGLTALGLIKRIACMALFAYNRKALSKKLRYYDVMLTAYIVGVGVYFMFSTSLLVVLSRGSLYFNALEPLLLASQVHLLTQRSSRFVMANAVCVLSFASFFQSISPYPDAFVPYKGLTINTEYSRGYVFYNH